MRRAVALLAAAIITACASASPPPGGPEDKTPPRLLSVTPDTNAVNVHPDHASFYFDETINDRGSGDQEVDHYFFVSPSEGETTVSWHRSRIDVKPRRGFKNGVTYSITMLPGLTDLRNNRMKEGRTVVFSTGATIPPYRITGIAFDWAAERPAALALIEAYVPGPDSIKYLAQADTIGKFSLGPMPPGTYLVRAIMDQNNNRALDRNEPFDTLRVNVPSGQQIEMRAALRDTFPTHILTVSLQDSLTLSVTFDRWIDPALPLDTSMFRLVGPDSVRVAILSARSPAQVRVVDSVARKAMQDSVRRADSLAGKPLAPRVAQPPAVGPGGKPLPPPPPKPSGSPPYTSVVLKLARPLPANTLYRLGATGVRALSGRTEPSERSFTTPKPPPPPAPKTAKDSAAAKPVTPPPTRPPRT